MREIERFHLEQVRAAVPISEPGLLTVLGARFAVLPLFDDATPTLQYVAVMIAFVVRIGARRPRVDQRDDVREHRVMALHGSIDDGVLAITASPAIVQAALAQLDSEPRARVDLLGFLRLAAT